MTDELMNAIISGLGTILIALVGYVSNALASYLKAKGLTDKLNKKKYLVDIAVNAIEQVYQNEDGEKKLQYARSEALRLLKENGLTVTEAELNSFVESAVKAMNDGFKHESVEGGNE